MMFGEIKSGQMVLNEYGVIVQTILGRTNQVYSDLTLDAFVVMPNHIHTLVGVKDRTSAQWAAEDENVRAAEGSRPYNAVTATFIRTFKTLATKELGFSLWQRSYYDNIVHDDEEYVVIKRYIASNPITWEKDRFYCTQHL